MSTSTDISEISSSADFDDSGSDDSNDNGDGDNDNDNGDGTDADADADVYGSIEHDAGADGAADAAAAAADGDGAESDPWETIAAAAAAADAAAAAANPNAGYLILEPDDDAAADAAAADAADAAANSNAGYLIIKPDTDDDAEKEESESLSASTTASTKAPTKASKPLALAPQKLSLSSEKEGKVFNEDYLKARKLLIEIQTSEIIINQIISKFFVKESRETYSEHYLDLLKSYKNLLYNPELINDDLIKLLEEYIEKQNEVLFPYLGSSQFKTSNNIFPPSYNIHHLNNILNKNIESPPPYENPYNLVGDADGDGDGDGDEDEDEDFDV